MADSYTRAMLDSFFKNGVITKVLKKSSAIRAIKAQPFYHAAWWKQPENKGDIIHFKRPDAFKESL